MTTTPGTTAVTARLPITYRQFDYWIRRGYIKLAEPTPGSGRPRPPLDPTEERVVALMAALVSDGVDPAKACEVARDLVASGRSHLGGLLLRLDTTVSS